MILRAHYSRAAMKQNCSIDYQAESDGLVNVHKWPFFEFLEILTRYTWINLMS